ncbi:hypothetical protein L5B97_00310 [Avibacterium sp. 20-15]|uniref:hypothetical protein n=1 Tax=unclassified Avibacterium TaxID=2685287 RepID=UPI00202708BF|nr:MULTISPECIES: hypothetical protein [unclassified Avibacterium]MCW9731944.1 hypothetical protein [Avibacterium sp. 20-15]URL04133.1 hypothetical protein L4F93_11390 [Avibacterium sp. 20-132]
MKKLFAPLNYLRLFHIEKVFFDIVLPIIFSVFFVYINSLLPTPITILGKNGLISIVNNITQILSGFYIAALAAIATASLPRLDDPLKGRPVKMLGNNRQITRRLFLTYLFGYLSFISLLIYALGGLAQINQANIKLLDNTIKEYLSLGYIFLLHNLAFVTLLGLYFMIEDNINRKA